MSAKKNVMIRVNAEVAERAKDIGLNISKVCENALFRAVEAMEAAYGENVEKSGTIAYARRDHWWAGEKKYFLHHRAFCSR